MSVIQGLASLPFHAFHHLLHVFASSQCSPTVGKGGGLCSHVWMNGWMGLVPSDSRLLGRVGRRGDGDSSSAHGQWAGWTFARLGSGSGWGRIDPCKDRRGPPWPARDGWTRPVSIHVPIEGSTTTSLSTFPIVRSRSPSVPFHRKGRPSGFLWDDPDTRLACPAVRRTNRCTRARHGHRRCVACVSRVWRRTEKGEKATRGRGHGACARGGTRRTGSSEGDGTRSDPCWFLIHPMDPRDERRSIRVQSKQKPGSIEETDKVDRNGTKPGEGEQNLAVDGVCEDACATTKEKSCNVGNSPSIDLAMSHLKEDRLCNWAIG